MVQNKVVQLSSEATTTFPGHALLWKKFGAHFELVSELSPRECITVEEIWSAFWLRV